MRGNSIAFLWMLASLLGIVRNVSAHPFFVSVTEIRMDTQKSTLNVSCRLFTDDLETALEKIYGNKYDLNNSTQNEAVKKTINEYVQKRLSIQTDAILQKLNFVGIEKEDEAMWIYFESTNFKSLKTIRIVNTLLFDYISEQTNVIHVYLNGDRKSARLVNPDKTMTFSF